MFSNVVFDGVGAVALRGHGQELAWRRGSDKSRVSADYLAYTETNELAVPVAQNGGMWPPAVSVPGSEPRCTACQWWVALPVASQILALTMLLKRVQEREKESRGSETKVHCFIFLKQPQTSP